VKPCDGFAVFGDMFTSMKDGRRVTDMRWLSRWCVDAGLWLMTNENGTRLNINKRESSTKSPGHNAPDKIPRGFLSGGTRGTKSSGEILSVPQQTTTPFPRLSSSIVPAGRSLSQTDTKVSSVVKHGSRLIATAFSRLSLLLPVWQRLESNDSLSVNASQFVV